MCSQIITHRRVGDEEALENVVGCELGSSHEDSAGGVWPDTTEQGCDSLLFAHPDDAVNRVLVVAALLDRQCRIILHADVHDICWVSNDTTDEAGCGCDRYKNWHGWGGGWGSEALLELFIDAEAGGGVGDLAEEGGGEAGVEAGETVALDDVNKCGDHRLWTGRGTCLEADLAVRLVIVQVAPRARFYA